MQKIYSLYNMLKLPDVQELPNICAPPSYRLIVARGTNGAVVGCSIDSRLYPYASTTRLASFTEQEQMKSK